MKFLLTCEHGGNEIPDEFVGYFKGAKDILDSHKGYDPGALDLFNYLKALADFHIYSTTSRLLVELNRSPAHPQLFSKFIKPQTRAVKEEIISRHYLPYRNSVEQKIRNWVGEGEQVIHFSIHSFTPVLDGQVRNADIGLLYDPSRPAEKALVKEFKKILLQNLPSIQIRYNYPYLGTADGLTTYLRKKFSEGYVGVELEVNQKYSHQNLLDPIISKNIRTSLDFLLQQKRRQKD